MMKKCICGCAIVAVVLLVCSSHKLVSQQPSKATSPRFFAKKQNSAKQKQVVASSMAPMTMTQRIVQLLNQEVDVGLLQQVPQMSLKQFLKMVESNLPETKGKLNAVVDRDNFILENPDAPDVLETEVSFLDYRGKVPLATLLRMALARVPTKNATFVIRRGMVEITTVARTSPDQLLRRKVTVVFIKKPLNQALQELSEQTGVSIIVDPRAGEKSQTPVTATFSHNVSLDAALIILTDMAGLKSVTLGRSVFITTPENARNLRREHKRLKKKNYQAPGFAPSAPGLGI